MCHCLLSTGSTGSLHLLVEEHITWCTCSNQCHKIECHNSTNDDFDRSSKSDMGKVVSKLYKAHDETHPPAAMVATWLGSANGLRSRPTEYSLQRKRRCTANDPTRQCSRCRISAVLKFRTSHTIEFLSVGLNLKWNPTYYVKKTLAWELVRREGWGSPSSIQQPSVLGNRKDQQNPDRSRTR